MAGQCGLLSASRLKAAGTASAAGSAHANFDAVRPGLLGLGNAQVEHAIGELGLDNLRAKSSHSCNLQHYWLILRCWRLHQRG